VVAAFDGGAVTSDTLLLSATDWARFGSAAMRSSGSDSDQSP
jgi:hypothetical protein